MTSFFENIFKYEKFPTEYECYKQFSDVENYIAVPWTQILNSHWLQFPGNYGRDYFLKEISKYKIETENNFTVCQHDSFMLLKNYYYHLKINKVFACAPYDYDKIENVDIVSMPYINIFNFDTLEKDILVSFLGSTTHDCREVIKNNIKNDHIIFRDTYHITSDFFTKNQKQDQEIEYKNVLSRSKFSLCPRGTNPNTIRFWESLAAGAIPILISDNYLLPDWDWDNTIIRIKESELKDLNYDKLKDILLNVNNEQVLRKNCLKAYKKFKKENYRDYIFANL